MLRHKILLSFCTCTALMYGQEVNLSEMTVSASKSALSVPATQATITDDTIAESVNLVNSEDAIKYLPSVQVRKRYIGDRNSIIVTRTSGSIASARSLVYADGVLLSNFLGNSFGFPPRWAMVTPEEIARMDLLYGPFSAEYPGNSVGNTLLITTKMPKKFQVHMEAQAFLEDYQLYGTKENYKGSQSAVSVGNKNGNLSWLLSYNHLDSSAHPMSYATFAPSAINATGADKAVTGYYKDKDPVNANRIVVGATSMDHTVQDTAKLKLSYDLTSASKLFYTYGYWQNDSHSDVNSYLRDANGASIASGTVNIEGKKYNLKNAFKPSVADQKHSMHALSYKTNTHREWDVEGTVSLYDYKVDDTRAPDISGGTTGTLTKQEGTGWKTGDLKIDYRPGYAASHALKFGVHYDRYKLNSETYNTANWLEGAPTALNSAFRGTTQTNAFFAQDVWKFAPDYRLILGGRYEKWEGRDGVLANATTTYFHSDRSENYISPKIALEHSIGEWLLRGAVGRAVRFPTVSELYQGSFSGSNTIINNDPNLKPEVALAYEVSAEKELENGTMRISVFYEDMVNALYSQTYTNSGGGTTTNIQNVDKIASKGVELAYTENDVLTDGLSLQGSVTYVNSEVKENTLQPAYIGKKQVRVPDWRATAVATYHQSKALDYTVAARYSGRQYNTMDNTDVNPNTFGGTSKFFIVDTKARYRFANGFGISAGIDNLNNYKSYAFHPYSQRTFFLKAQYDF